MASKFPKFGYNPVTGEWNDSLSGEFLGPMSILVKPCRM